MGYDRFIKLDISLIYGRSHNSHVIYIHVQDIPCYITVR